MEEPKRSPMPVRMGMSFGSCLNVLVSDEGKTARRLAWPSDGTYIRIKDDKLVIWTPVDKQFHPLTVSTGDIVGEDWIGIGSYQESVGIA